MSATRRWWIPPGRVDSATVDTLVSHLDAGLEAASDHPTRVLVVELGDVTYLGAQDSTPSWDVTSGVSPTVWPSGWWPATRK